MLDVTSPSVTSVDGDASLGGRPSGMFLVLLLVISFKPITVMAAKTIVSITTIEDKTNEDDEKGPEDPKNDAELLVFAFDRIML